MPKVAEERRCKGCNLPPPDPFGRCWENKLFDCWMGLPPRNIDTMSLWKELKDVRHRLDMLEEPPT